MIVAILIVAVLGLGLAIYSQYQHDVKVSEVLNEEWEAEKARGIRYENGYRVEDKTPTIESDSVSSSKEVTPTKEVEVAAID